MIKIIKEENKKEKININPNAGNVPVGISHFNNSTISSSQLGGESSMGEALKDLQDLNEDDENTLCGYDISQPLILSRDEFLSFMDEVIKESEIK